MVDEMQCGANNSQQDLPGYSDPPYYSGYVGVSNQEGRLIHMVLTARGS